MVFCRVCRNGINFEDIQHTTPTVKSKSLIILLNMYTWQIMRKESIRFREVTEIGRCYVTRNSIRRRGNHV